MATKEERLKQINSELQKIEIEQFQAGDFEDVPQLDEAEFEARDETLADSVAAEPVAPAGAFERFAQGARAGFRREEAGGTIAERVGEFTGRFGLPVAGSLALGAAAVPLAAGAAAAGGFAAGATGLSMAAGAAGLGAGGGEAFGQIGARLFGGQAPETPGQAAKEIGLTGLEGAASELGVGLAGKVVKGLLPTMSQVFLKMPAESIKRAIKNPKLMPVMGNAARLEVEKTGISVLRKLQKSMEQARDVAGKKVDQALAKFQRRVRGERVVDLTAMADEADAIINQASFNEPVIAELVKGGDLKKMQKLIKVIRKNPTLDPVGAISLRRQLDDLIAFKKGGVKVVSSDLGERTVRSMAARLRQSIKEAADQFGFPDLEDANFAFARIANTFDEVSAEIGTKTLSTRDLLGRLNKITTAFNRGGVSAEILGDFASKVPGGFRLINELLDSVASRAFTELPVGTPSSAVKDFIKLVGAPANVGRVSRGALAISPTVRGITRPAVIGALPRE